MDLTSLILIGGIAVFIIFLLAISYVKTSPNVAMVISGLSKKPRYLVGKGGISYPSLGKD